MAWQAGVTTRPGVAPAAMPVLWSGKAARSIQPMPWSGGACRKLHYHHQAPFPERISFQLLL